MNEERRTWNGDIEHRDGENGRMAVGYASKFDVRSQNLGGFVEKVAPTAFNKTIQEADVVALRDHDMSRLLGRVSAGTLRLAVDQVGLRYEIDLPDTTEGRDTLELLRRRDLIGSSFGFRTIRDTWGETETGYPLRTLEEVALRDVGPVTSPAYTSSEVALRHLAETTTYDLRELVEAADADELSEMISSQRSETLAAVEPAPPLVFHRPRRF